MANANEFLIAANDEHGLNPPTAGKRTPLMPGLNRSIYENEFNRQAKYYFILAALRCGYRILDVKPEEQDVSISTRVSRVNSRGASLLVTYAYNAYGSGTGFNNVNGHITFYSPRGYRPTMSRLLAYDVSSGLNSTLPTRNLGVGTLSDVGVLNSVRCPSVLLECGFMTNLDEAKLMLDPDFQRAAGEGAAIGVCGYLDVSFVEPNVRYPLIRFGSRGNYVAIAQYILKNYGYNVTPDGVFGTQTQNAATDFQRNNGLAVDGIIGNNTWNALLLRTRPRPTLRRGSRGTFVRYLQEKLLSNLIDPGTPDGIFGARTEAAVEEYQRSKNLTPDGIVGRATWSALSNSN